MDVAREAGGGGTGSVRRRRERRLRQWHRHERMTVAMALAEFTHHSAPRSSPRPVCGFLGRHVALRKLREQCMARIRHVTKFAPLASVLAELRCRYPLPEHNKKAPFIKGWRSLFGLQLITWRYACVVLGSFACTSNRRVQVRSTPRCTPR